MSKYIKVFFYYIISLLLSTTLIIGLDSLFFLINCKLLNIVSDYSTLLNRAFYIFPAILPFAVIASTLFTVSKIKSLFIKPLKILLLITLCATALSSFSYIEAKKVEVVKTELVDSHYLLVNTNKTHILIPTFLDIKESNIIKNAINKLTYNEMSETLTIILFFFSIIILSVAMSEIFYLKSWRLANNSIALIILLSVAIIPMATQKFSRSLYGFDKTEISIAANIAISTIIILFKTVQRIRHEKNRL